MVLVTPPLSTVLYPQKVLYPSFTTYPIRNTEWRGVAEIGCEEKEQTAINVVTWGICSKDENLPSLERVSDSRSVVSDSLRSHAL